MQRHCERSEAIPAKQVTELVEVLKPNIFILTFSRPALACATLQLHRG
jgi:hypothetical protein